MNAAETAPDLGRDHVLTWRQRKVLQAIADSVRDRGYAPSQKEIGEAAGLASNSSVSYHLRTLERRGYLHREPGRPRALEVRMPGQKRPDPAAERERAEAAEAKLAAVTAYCQARADEFNAQMPLRVRPQDMKVSAGDILAIISGEETGND